MRLFLGGVVAGCLSSASLFLARSHFEHPPTETPLQLPTPAPPSMHPDPAGDPLLLHPPTDVHHTPSPPPPPPHPIKGTTTTTSTTTTSTSRAEQILAHGRPSGGRLLKHYHNHILEYDCSRRIPVWVAEHLTADSLKGNASRSRSRFRSDPDIPEECSAHNNDYRGSGWSRGHMAPSGDNKGSQDAMDSTFFLSNILPQDFDNNAGFWNRLEIFCRDLTQRYSDVWVTSGPVFLPTVTEDGKKQVTYEVIGTNEVAVPTHLYKIIVARKGDQVATGAFIVPNQPLTYAHHLTSFQVPLAHLERKVGTRFHTNLDRSSAADLCQETGCNLLGKEEMDLLIYSSRLKRAGDRRKLDKLWREIQERNIPTTGKLQEVYEGRLGELGTVAAGKSREEEVEEEKVKVVVAGA